MTIILAPLIAALVTLTLIGCSDASKKDQRRVKVAATDLALRSAVADMAKRSNADLSWMAAIAPDRASPFRPLYSVDLEKLWLIDRPIVFVGELANVATEN